jgi:hypothetical protein
MRKRIITSTETVRSHSQDWLDIERAAIVEVTSEDKDHPIESALVAGDEQVGARRHRAPKPFD